MAVPHTNTFNCMSVVIQAPVRARMPDSRNVKSIGEAQLMTNLQKIVQKRWLISLIFAIFIFEFGASPAFSQRAIPRDPAEPAQGKPQPKILPRPAGRVARVSVDEKSMRALIGQLVACGTRLTLSSWTDSKRGIGCGRDAIVARMNEIAKSSGGKLQVMDPQADAAGADDDASGVAVGVECARLLSKASANGRGTRRATILFAAVS